MAHIAVIIPVWQHLRELTRCLRALERQMFRDFEAVVVDDGNTPPLALPSSEYRIAIRMLRQEHAGAPAARNFGAAQSTSEFLLFCDADVALAPNALERMVHVLDEHRDASYAYSAFRFGWKRFPSFTFSAERLRRMPYIHTTALIRRAHFPGFDAMLQRFQDWDLWLTMLERGYVGVYIPETLFSIRNTRGTMSRWVPSFLYRLPWKLSRVRAYEDTATVIRKKHAL